MLYSSQNALPPSPFFGAGEYWFQYFGGDVACGVLGRVFCAWPLFCSLSQLLIEWGL